MVRIKEKGSPKKKTSTNHIRSVYYFLIVVLVVFVLALIYYFRYVSLEPALVSSGIRQGTTSVSKYDPIVLRCIEICKASKSVGISLDNGLCLDNNVQGYSCAVVVNDNGHCPAYFEGAEEIILDENCKYIGVYKEGGED